MLGMHLLVRRVPSKHPINLHQRCGYSDLPFARIHDFYTTGSRNGFEGVEVVCPPQLTLRKRHFFVIEKYIEDARQDEKHVPDLLESIMRPTDPVKKKLRPNLFKISEFGAKIPKIKVSTFWWKSEVFPLEANASLLASRF